MQHTIYFQIRSIYQGLRPSEQKVADFILNYDEVFDDLSLALIEKEVGVSQPTIVRFVKALNFHSFKQFKYALLRSEQTSSLLYGFDLEHIQSLEDIPSLMIATSMSMLEDCLQSISVQNYRQAIELIHQNDNIALYAVENSANVARDLMTKLLYLGKHVTYHDDYYLQNIDASNLTSQSLAIGISYSGNSVNTLEALKLAKRNHAKTITISNFKDALIHQYSDVSLCTSQKQYLYGDAIFSRTTQTALVDMLYVGVMLCDKEKYTEKLDKYSQLIKMRGFQKDR
ncbi:MAG: MurR/RpiR family transcriptional regulator [Coprobacillus sp.]